jgi:hypothetical protein
MKPFSTPHRRGIFNFRLFLRNILIFFASGLMFLSCNLYDSEPLIPVTADKIQVAEIHGSLLDAITTLGVLKEPQVTVRSHGSGYHANAKCKGFIPAGEYAGHRFSVEIEGEYSGLGPETLVTGSALVRIRGERFESVISMDLNSFCCGEGYILDLGDHYEFVVFGQVEHSTAPIPHNHLFAGLGSTLGFMNFNVMDQSGTITEPPPGGPLPHDPGIGLIEEVPARPVNVEYIP